MATASIINGTDTTGGHSIGTLHTTDPDAGDTFTYTIRPGDDAALFSIGGDNDDELLLDDGVIDIDEKDEYVVTVRTTDAGNLHHDEVFTITVVEVAGGLTIAGPVCGSICGSITNIDAPIAMALGLM